MAFVSFGTVLGVRIADHLFLFFVRTASDAKRITDKRLIRGLCPPAQIARLSISRLSGVLAFCVDICIVDAVVWCDRHSCRLWVEMALLFGGAIPAQPPGQWVVQPREGGREKRRLTRGIQSRRERSVAMVCRDCEHLFVLFFCFS